VFTSVEFKQISEKKIRIITVCDKFATESHTSRVGYDLFV